MKATQALNFQQPGTCGLDRVAYQRRGHRNGPVPEAVGGCGRSRQGRSIGAENHGVGAALSGRAGLDGFLDLAARPAKEPLPHR